MSLMHWGKFLAVPLLGMALLVSSPSYADIDPDTGLDTTPTDWILKKKDKRRNIEMYLKQEEGKRLKSFHLTTELAAKPESIAAVFTDFDNFCAWVFRCGQVKVLQKISDTDFILYMVHTAPFGIEDRDTILRGRATKDTKNKSVLIQTWAMPRHLPVEKGIVRMTHESMEWRFTPNKETGKFKLELTGYADPGGKIPGWIANLVQLDAPYYSVRGLMRVLEDSKYDNPSLPKDVAELFRWGLQVNNIDPAQSDAIFGKKKREGSDADKADAPKRI